MEAVLPLAPVSAVCVPGRATCWKKPLFIRHRVWAPCSHIPQMLTARLPANTRTSTAVSAGGQRRANTHTPLPWWSSGCAGDEDTQPCTAGVNVSCGCGSKQEAPCCGHLL